MCGVDRIQEASRRGKIDILESNSQTAEVHVIKKIVSLLNDPDIEVRGEAFGALVLNENDISETIIESLNHKEKNVRAFASLVLGNRGARNAVEPLRRLTRDNSPAVRSCALGSLGYLSAAEAEEEIRICFSDDSIEVKRSALKAAMDIGCNITEQELEDLSEDDEELQKLVAIARQKYR